MTLKVILVGPIKAWWDEWGSERHNAYTAWRELVSVSLVDAGVLVYRPHEAWKGNWDEAAQAVNDAAIAVCDLVVNLTPEGVPSKGTDDELLLCQSSEKVVVDAPPGDLRDLANLVHKLRVLGTYLQDA